MKKSKYTRKAFASNKALRRMRLEDPCHFDILYHDWLREHGQF
jgi:hypothetical protein